MDRLIHVGILRHSDRRHGNLKTSFSSVYCLFKLCLLSTYRDYAAKDAIHHHVLRERPRHRVEVFG